MRHKVSTVMKNNNAKGYKSRELKNLGNKVTKVPQVVVLFVLEKSELEFTVGITIKVIIEVLSQLKNKMRQGKFILKIYLFLYSTSSLPIKTFYKTCHKCPDAKNMSCLH